MIRRIAENHPGTIPGGAMTDMRGGGGGRGIRSPSPPHPGGRVRARALPFPPQPPFLHLVLLGPGVESPISTMPPLATSMPQHYALLFTSRAPG